MNNFIIPLNKDICDTIDPFTFDFLKSLGIDSVVDIYAYEKETGNEARLGTIFVTNVTSDGRVFTAAEKNLKIRNEKYKTFLWNQHKMQLYYAEIDNY